MPDDESPIKITRGKVSDLIQDDLNANEGTDLGAAMLDDSLGRLGTGRSVLVDSAGRLIAGNKTQAAALRQGIQETIIIETTGDQLVVVKRKDIDLDSPEGREMALADNAIAAADLQWNQAVLRQLDASGIELTDYLPESLLDEIREVEIADDTADVPAPSRSRRAGTVDALDKADSGDEEPFSASGKVVPLPGDEIFASNNDWGVPTLDLRMQATSLDAPVLKWGTIGRKAAMPGTYHFYTDDYKFNGLWQHPETLLYSGCKNAVEPNFSTSGVLPRALALGDIYKRRWLGRWWQKNGVRMFVDVCIWPSLYDIILLGVPRGWTAFATRAYQIEPDALIAAYNMALAHSGEPEIMFLVVGGREPIRKLCQERSWLWVREDSSRVHDTLSEA